MGGEVWTSIARGNHEEKVYGLVSQHETWGRGVAKFHKGVAESHKGNHGWRGLIINRGGRSTELNHRGGVWPSLTG